MVRMQNNFRQALARAARVRQGRSNTMTMTRRKNIVSGAGVTTQHDRRQVYRKKTMPRYKKKRWRSFKRKVQAISEKDLGSRQVVFNKSVTITNSTGGNQLATSVYIYSGYSTTSSLANDMNNISALENPGNPTAAAGITVGNSTRFMFQSAVMDMTVRNSSTFTDVDSTDPATGTKLEVDVYEITSSRYQAFNAGLAMQILEDCLALNTNETSAIGGAGTEVRYDLRGVTPFELSYSISRCKLKILKKTKYFLPWGDTFTYQIRDPRRHVKSQEQLENDNGWNVPGMTRALLVVAKMVPGYVVGTGANTYQEKIEIGITRKYMYKVEGGNDDRTRYLQGI